MSSVRGLRPVELLAVGAALPIGIAIGVLDARAEEVQSTVLLLLVAGALLAFAAPRRALLLGVLLGLGVPIVHAYVRVAHLSLPYTVNSYWSTFIALVPALLATSLVSAPRQLRRD